MLIDLALLVGIWGGT